ncbi:MULTISPECIES: DoxX family protein [unclassified Spirosoma]|uniref:DoxX family protein n=1 Tax=unclassified Spirosoma TaxID=2621999 RepID=UPI000960FD55|nr:MULTISPECIES: DoxX family protein [unclassified Spirosoma]MBN8822678.1 DoxX family protein [Spirosoma sp.]OJW74161.1 MAG: DoxX-like family protein [Spirosoma sp. 48-14]
MTHIQINTTNRKALKKTNILYWILTGLFAFVMAGSAIPNIMVNPMSVQGFHEMGYPTYIIPFLGWAKLLGVVAILVPGFPRLKEWAYAGLIFDLLGATYSVANSGKELVQWAPIFIFVALGFGSYYAYHKKRKVLALQHPAATQRDFQRNDPAQVA